MFGVNGRVQILVKEICNPVKPAQQVGGIHQAAGGFGILLRMQFQVLGGSPVFEAFNLLFRGPVEENGMKMGPGRHIAQHKFISVLHRHGRPPGNFSIIQAAFNDVIPTDELIPEHLVCAGCGPDDGSNGLGAFI